MGIRAPITDLAEGERALGPDLSHYLCRVLRLGQGDRFVAFDSAARVEADAVVVEASADGARVRIETPRPGAVVSQTRLVLIHALGKGDKVDAIVRDATELGAARIVIAHTERTIVKVERAAGRQERWRRVAEGAPRPGCPLAKEAARAPVPAALKKARLEIMAPPPWCDGSDGEIIPGAGAVW